MPGPDSVSSVLLLYVKGELGLPLMIRAQERSEEREANDVNS